MVKPQLGSTAPIAAPQDSLVYNRVAEQTRFIRKFADEPKIMTVLVGPPNCGKTTFLRNLVSQLRGKPDPPLILMIDGRLSGVTRPDDISKALCDAVVSASLVGRAQSSAGGLGGALAEFMLSASTLKDEKNLAETLKKLHTLFEKLKQLPNKPVVIIDEANNLMDWEEQGVSNRNLKKLLNFLTAITKQDKLAHVVLATSDSLASWLSDHGLTTDKFKVEVLGNLTEEEAREFVYGTEMVATIAAAAVADPGNGATVPAPEGTWPGIVNNPSSRIEVPHGAEGQWQAMFERCGGNIGLLIQCVAAAREEGAWNDALDSVVINPQLTIENAFKPMALTVRDGMAPLWTGKQWELVLERITTAPHHAVLREELVTALEKQVPEGKSGEEILMSMVRYNFLVFRPYSTLPRDLPREVYGKRKSMVVTLPLPVHVWAAKEWLKERNVSDQ